MDKVLRSIALIGDTHCGSEFSIFPKHMEIEGHGTYGGRAGQVRMYEYFLDFVKQCKDYKVDSVYHLGDVIEGAQRKDGGRFTLTPDLEIQKEMAVQILTPLLKGRKFYIVSGSGYHESLDTNIAGQFAKHLNAEKVCQAEYLGAVRDVMLAGTKKTMNLQHGSGNSLMYQATGLDKEGREQIISASQEKINKCDLIIRGHLHNYVSVKMRKQHMIQLPAWQAFVPSKIGLKSVGKMQSDIGGVILLVMDSGEVRDIPFIYKTVKYTEIIVR